MDLKEIWQEYEKMLCPSKEEMEDFVSKQRYSILNVQKENITEEYIKMQSFYKFLFGIYFVTKSNIYKVEEELKKRGYGLLSVEKMNFLQRYDGLGLKYIYYRGWTHIERLTDEEKTVLERSLKEPESKELFMDALYVVEKTCYKVLAINPEKKEERFELFPSIHGEGRVKGANIVFAIGTTGQEEKNKNMLPLGGIVKQLEAILSKMMNAEVIFVEG